MKTLSLEDLGIRFDPSSGCNTCNHEICSNSATCLDTGKEYYLIIQKFTNRFSISEVELPDACSEMSKISVFDEENELVNYLVNHYQFQGCF